MCVFWLAFLPVSVNSNFSLSGAQRNQPADMSSDVSFGLQPHEDGNITTVSGLNSHMSRNIARYSKGDSGVAFAYICFFGTTVSVY